MNAALRTVAATALLAVLGGCATAPVMQDAETLSADTSLVFGSAEIYVNDEKLKLGFSWSAENHFYLLILPPGSNVATTYEITNEGTFYWALPPGEYLLLGYRWQQAGNARTGDIRTAFSVPAGGADTYIGSLEFRGTEYSLVPGMLDRYLQAAASHDERFPERRGKTVRQLMQPPERPGNYSGMLPACHARFALECDDRFRGVTPIAPQVATSGFPPVRTLQPEFAWKGSARTGIHYDVIVYEAATYTINQVTDFYARGRLAAYAEDIAATSWQPDKTLKPGTRYFWSVRSRDGDVVSDWSTQSYFSFALVAFTSGYGQWFQFQTP